MNKQLPKDVCIKGYDYYVLASLWERIKDSPVAWSKTENNLDDFLSNMRKYMSFCITGHNFFLWFEINSHTGVIRAHGYFFAPSVLKQTGIIRDCFEHLFSTLNPIRIETYFPDDLIWIHRVVQKIGFKKDGVLRHHYILNETIVNTAVYSLIKEDFNG